LEDTPLKDYWDIVKPLKQTVRIYEQPDSFLKKFRATPEVGQVLLASFWCQSEVCDGGFLQLFFNSSGVLVPESVIAFEKLGMPCVAQLVAEALLLFGEPYPRSRLDRQKQLAEHWDRKPGIPPYPYARYELDGGQVSTQVSAMEIYFEQDRLMFEHGPFAHLDKKFFEQIDEENGGFEQCANAYATSSSLRLIEKPA
jgi:hypothetical protein